MALLLALVAGCGGGGGGGAQGGSSTGGDGGIGPARSPGTAVIAADLSVFLKSNMIRDLTYEGVPAHQVNMLLGLEGDLSTAQGGTLFVAVTDPEGIYVPPFVLLNDASSLGLTFMASQGFQPAAGRHTGVLTISVCLDAGCGRPLRNSPVRVPYDIEVRPGFGLTPAGVDQQFAAGTTPSPAVLTVTPPAEATSWFILPWGKVGGAEDGAVEIDPAWLQRTGNTLAFEPPSNLLPGLYALEFMLDAAVPDPVYPATSVVIRRKFTIRHRVVNATP